MENEKKINKRIGTFTFGIILVLLGISALVQIFFPYRLVKYILMLWPVLFISLGIEALYYNYRKDIEIKYSFVGTLLLVFLLTVASIFAVGNYFINDILYNPNNIKTINDTLSSKSYHFNINKDGLNLINLSGKTVNLSIIPFNDDENSENSKNDMFVKPKYNLKTTNSLIIELMDNNIYNYFIANSNDSTITITNLPEYIESINIIVYSNNINSITQTNCNITNI